MLFWHYRKLRSKMPIADMRTYISRLKRGMKIDMKKELILAAAIMAMGLLSGCGAEDGGKVEAPEVEIITDGQAENGKPDSETSEGGGQDDGLSESGAQDGEPSDGGLTESGQQGDGQINSEQANGVESDESQFSFEDIADRTFYFSSGAGAWCTELRINGDGAFEGIYHDSDMGDIGDAYPNGTLYYCEFSGVFGNPEKVDAYTYKMELISIKYEQEPEKVEIIDGVKTIYSTAYGIDGGDEFYLYLPGIKLSDLPEEYRGWVGYYNLESVSETELPYYGLYNIAMGEGFSSYVYEERSLSEKIEAEISYAETRSAELETKLQEEDVTQLDMNETAKELFQVWDDALNTVWKMLEDTLNESDMEALRAEEREWIKQKDAKVKEAGAEFEGGSIQAMVEFMEAAELTEERVRELADMYK